METIIRWLNIGYTTEQPDQNAKTYEKKELRQAINDRIDALNKKLEQSDLARDIADAIRRKQSG